MKHRAYSSMSAGIFSKMIKSQPTASSLFLTSPSSSSGTPQRSDMNSFRKNSDRMDKMYLCAGKVRLPACSVTSWMLSISSDSSRRRRKCCEKDDGETLGISYKLSRRSRNVQLSCEDHLKSTKIMIRVCKRKTQTELFFFA